MARLLAVIGIVLGAGGGIAAALLTGNGTPDAEPAPEPAVVARRMDRQFVLPVLEEGRVAGHAVLTLAIETSLGADEAHVAEPRLRDAFLSALVAQSAEDGFGGAIASPEGLDALRALLLRAGQRVVGDDLHGVLIDGLAFTASG